MGTLSTKQTDHLYWLGRYLERVKMTLELTSELYDQLIDSESEFDVDTLCERLAIPNIYSDVHDFATRYMFDKDDPNSVPANLERAFDNAVVMRDVLTTDTLSYIQLAINAMARAKVSVSPMLEVQETTDYIYAFWGAVEDNVTDVQTRYIMRTGRSVERIDLLLRLRVADDKLKAEAARLANRLYRSRMNYDAEIFQRFVECFERGNWEPFARQLLDDVNCLVQI